MQKNDILYLFSDGYADQRSGKTGRRFLLSNFEKLLIHINKLSLPEQKQFLINQHKKMKNNKYNQTDDILIIGVKI